MFLTSVWTGLAQPVITNQPYSQAVFPGGNVTFTIGASGTEPLSYQWQKDSGTGFCDLAGRRDVALALTNAQPWEAADYRVVVTNVGGASTSAVAHLYVSRFSPVS